MDILTIIWYRWYQIRGCITKKILKENHSTLNAYSGDEDLELMT